MKRREEKLHKQTKPYELPPRTEVISLEIKEPPKLKSICQKLHGRDEDS